MTRFNFRLSLSLLLLATSFNVPSHLARAAEPLTAEATINADKEAGTLSRHLFGQFAEHLGNCIYDGIWVGPDSAIPNTRGVRNDIAAALKEIAVPNLRWPGGCFADDYHWRDGIGPSAKRPRTVNIHWGQVIDTNAFGTHEFLDLCEQIGCEPYLAGNVGSGTPQEMRDWVEYLTYDGDSDLANLRRANGRENPWKIKYFGVGNENWGCGGEMKPEHYADLFRQFGSYCRDLSGNKLTRVACGPGGLNQNWTRVVMDRAADRMQALSLHFYTVRPNWQNKLPATGFGEQEWFDMLKESLVLERAIKETEEIMDRVDQRKRIELYVDEWGSWYSTESGHPGYGLYQQNSLRDAVLAGISFHILFEHNDRVRMANIAQVVNVLQSMILTEKEKMLLTPTYHVFGMYKVHQDATRLPVDYKSPDYKVGDKTMPALSIAASRDKSGAVHVSVVNAHATSSAKLTADLPGVKATKVTGRILTADKLDAHNTFESPNAVKPADFTGATLDGTKLTAEIPSHSVVVLELK